MAIDPRFKKIYLSGKDHDLYKFVPKTSYADPSLASTQTETINPYDIKDELYELFQERERIEEERKAKQHPGIGDKQHVLLHSSNLVSEADKVVELLAGPAQPKLKELEPEKPA